MEKKAYSNSELELLKSVAGELFGDMFNADIDKIQEYYAKFNSGIKRYTDNYYSSLTAVFDGLHIKQYIPASAGGELHLLVSTPYDTDRFIKAIRGELDAYLKKLEGLKYLAFLAEEKRNVVFVGANGAGKTTLLRHLIKVTGASNISYYQADRLMLVDVHYNPERDMTAFNKSVSQTYTNATDLETYDQGTSIKNQFNQMIALFEKMRSRELERITRGELGIKESKTGFILDTWNGLIKDRELYCDGTLKIRMRSGEEYGLKYLSSGEKSILYFLISILLQDRKRYYFIDEPENNLNPSIISKLWDIIEEQIPNAIFVYLTHNSEFVASRVNAKIYWIKRYDGREWEYELLPENDNLPQELMINLVGTKQPILFCESENEYKFDSIVYKLLFPNMRVVASGGCSKVMDKVKAYKKLGFPETAYGIIDCDYRREEFLMKQRSNYIFYIPFFEIENFLFCEEILRRFIATYCNNDQTVFDKIFEKVKEDFTEFRETFIIRNVATRLHERGFGGKIKALRSREELEADYKRYIASIDLEKLYKEYEDMIDGVLSAPTLNKILRYYDNKSILRKYNRIFGLDPGEKYEVLVMDLLKEDKALREALVKQYFEFLPSGSGV